MEPSIGRTSMGEKMERNIVARRLRESYLCKKIVTQVPRSEVPF